MITKKSLKMLVKQEPLPISEQPPIAPTSSPASGNTVVVRSPNIVSESKPNYFNRPPQLFDEILLLCNGKSYREISTALKEVESVILDKSIMNYSVNHYTPKQKLKE